MIHRHLGQVLGRAYGFTLKGQEKQKIMPTVQGYNISHTVTHSNKKDQEPCSSFVADFLNKTLFETGRPHSSFRLLVRPSTVPGKGTVGAPAQLVVQLFLLIMESTNEMKHPLKKCKRIAAKLKPLQPIFFTAR